MSSEKIKRYLIFFIGLFVNSLGVSLITKASLGTSPISSIPYVLSLYFPLSLGTFTILFSVLLVVLQIVILGRQFQIRNLWQIPVSVFFGYFIDLTMEMLFFVHPQIYPASILVLLAGTIILGVGVYMEVLADVIMLPGESFVKAVVLRWKTDFGLTKVCFDASMSIIAAVLSFLFFASLQGVREGTVVAAVLVGAIARAIGRKLSFLPKKLFVLPHTEEAEETGRGICIVFSREYGSGGHAFAQKLAAKLDYAFYDEEIITLTAKKTGFDQKFIQEHEESMGNPFLYDLVNEGYGYSDEYRSMKDELFLAESKVIRSFSDQNCVVVGRCADWVLHGQKNCIKVFLHAPLQQRIQTVMKREHLSEHEAAARIHRMDKMRKENYHYYTKQVWGMADNYDICIDSSVGEEKMTACIMQFMKDLA